MSVVQVVAFLVAFVAQFSRIFVATRPFWSKLPTTVQVLLPPLVPALAAFGEGLTGVKSWTDLTVVFIGCAALILPGLPSNRSAAPLQASKPVTGTPSAGDHAVAAVIKSGAVPPKPPSIPPLAAAGLFALCLVLGGCAFLRGSVWPATVSCAPGKQDLIDAVTKLLLDDSADYEAGLEALAKQYTASEVVCVVDALVTEWQKPSVKLGDHEALAYVRGKNFLAKAGTKVERQ